MNILYSFGFCIGNIATVGKLFPLIPDNAEADSKAIKKDPTLRVSDDMPIAGIIAIWLSFNQWLYYLQIFDGFNLQIKLLVRSF